jgi:spore coat polysaccharide biosynthesis protein SpsF
MAPKAKGRVGNVVAARTASTRHPGKALLALNGVPTIAFLLRRLKGATSGEVVVATTTSAADDRLAAVARDEGVLVFRGPEYDVVARYVACAKEFDFATVARVTGDCPFVDAALVDWCIGQVARGGPFDLASTKGEFPVGLDVEIYGADDMARLNATNLSVPEREHLTLHYYQHPERFKLVRITPPVGWPRTKRHFTIDTRADYEAACRLAERFHSPWFSISALLAEAAALDEAIA